MRLLVLLLPWLELFTLVQLGIQTSALTVLLYVLATLVVGVLILRQQGTRVFERVRGLQQGAVLGPKLLMDDMAMGLAAMLLMFPGMITDLAAIMVMIGPLRRRLASALAGPSVEPYAPGRDVEADSVIEGQYTRVDERDRS